MDGGVAGSTRSMVRRGWWFGAALPFDVCSLDLTRCCQGAHSQQCVVVVLRVVLHLTVIVRKSMAMATLANVDAAAAAAAAIAVARGGVGV